MNKKCSISLVCILYFIFSFAFYQVKAEETTGNNLIINGSFEKTSTATGERWENNIKPDGWDVWIPSGNPQLMIDPDVSYEGDQSLRINAPSTSRADILQDIPITTGANYKFSAWVKTNQVEAASEGGAFIRTQYLDAAGRKVSDGPYTSKLKGDHDWTLLEMNIAAPDNAKIIRVELFLETATGTVWFDHVSMEETDEVFLTGFDLEEDYIALKKGENKQLTPLFQPENATNKEVSWESSKPDSVTVNEAGEIHAKDYGYATIKAQTHDGGHQAEAFVSVESEATIESYDTIRLNWFDKLTGNSSFNPEDPDMATYISELEQRLTNSEQTGHWDTMNKAEDRDYLWESLQSTTNSSQISTAYGHIRDMAQAYSMKGPDLFQDEQLQEDIIGALEWMYENRYHEQKNIYDNWWDWEIGTPQILNNIIVLMYDDLPQAHIDKYIKTIDHFVPDPAKRKANSSVTETGANLLDKALVVTLRGIIGKNEAKVLQGSSSIENEYLYVEQGDGVYRDGSLVQHSDIAYSGGYGAVWMNRTADMLYLLNDSPWELTDSNVHHVYDWVSDSFEPLIYQGAMMDMVRGRAISRENERDYQNGKGTILSILRLSDSAPAEQQLQMKQMVKEWVENSIDDNYAQGLAIYEIGLLKSLINDSSIQPRGELIKNQMFAGMARAVHLRPQFGFGLSMFSNRISGFEYGNGENKKGWYTGVGMTYLYNPDLAQYNNDYWPTIDSNRLPGTTTDHSTGNLVAWKSYMNPKKWVGGVSHNNRYGAAGMDFSLSELTGSTLSGKKSWFMFDDEIVAIGSDIHSSDDRQVETIIENRQLKDSGDNKLVINGSEQPTQLGWSETIDQVNWAHLQGNVDNADIGYFFPADSEVAALREARTGSWHDLNNGGSQDSITRNYLSLAFNHGVNPQNEGYAYVLLPNMSVKETEDYSHEPHIEILTQTSAVHAVKEHQLGILAANFWEGDVTADVIRSHQPASVLVREEEDVLTLSVSDPTMEQDTIIIDLGKIGLSVIDKDDSVTVDQSSAYTKVEVDVSESVGQTHTVSFEYQQDIQAADIKKLVEQFEQEEAFHRGNIAHTLQVHVTNLEKFASQGEDEKIIKHLKVIRTLLDNHKKNEVINDYAYHTLYAITHSFSNSLEK
ncbi:polysaccharide lyase family 8 super-sandwich domain-containing protein [Gracilibacillus alcaliphilus]|uniref:polysaccharide lyase family 8 super-sandwich domain-containing protein n=1 Tax=Gracilibacillus alcaliphilus TaxID=1401441 RepID=UPI001957E6CA|nr:polysaccharide lyase family 8 super-sandwich domain-containing protein [Gracilibacillus alcaliphilus]MBM7677466.1 hyaluronate lyase [Gracilibacillus alcaliphilus]